MRVMIVDDSMFMRRLVRNHITRLGHEIVAEGENGVEAVKLYHKHHPDIVFMDIVMPEMTGIQALRAIKVEDPDAKVVICSSMGHQAYVEEAIMDGAMDFIVKPFKAEHFERILERFSN